MELQVTRLSSDQITLSIALFKISATMTATTVDTLFEGSTGRNTRGLLRLVILCTIAAAAIASRLFSVIRTYGLSLCL